MNNKHFFLIAILLGAIGFTSCSKKTNMEGRYVPLKAEIVFLANGASIHQKLPWAEVKATSFFKRMMADSNLNQKLKGLLENPESSGVNIKNNILAFVMNDSLGQYVGFEGFLTDAHAFGKLVKEESKEKLNFSENSGLNMGNGQGVGLAWNTERFLFVFGIPKTGKGFNIKNIQYPATDSIANPSEEFIDQRNYGDLVKQVFTLKESESLGAEEKFTELVSDKADIHFWMNNEELYSSQSGEMPSFGPLSMLNFTKLTKDARATASLNFDNGKIAVNFKTYMGKDVADLLSKNLNNHADAEMLKHISPENLAMLLQFSVKPEIINGYLKLLGADGFANMGAGMLGFSIDDLIAANKGDFLLAISNIRPDSSKPNIDYLFASAIKNKEAFDKVLGAVNKMMKNYNQGGTDSTLTKVQNLFNYNKSEKYFALGANQTQVDGFLKGNGTYSSPIFDKISSGPGGLYINFNYIMNALSPMVKDSADLAALDASKLVWQNLLSTSDKFNGRFLTGHVEINLVDKNVNSLKQLNSYLDKLGTIFIIKEKERKAQIANSLKDIPNY